MTRLSGVFFDAMIVAGFAAIAFGAPLLLLMSFAGQAFNNALMVLVIVVVMYIVYNLILFRNSIFKKKNNK